MKMKLYFLKLSFFKVCITRKFLKQADEFLYLFQLFIFSVCISDVHVIEIRLYAFECECQIKKNCSVVSIYITNQTLLCHICAIELINFHPS